MTPPIIQPRMHQNSGTGKLAPSVIADLKPVRYARKVSDGDGLYVLITPKGGRGWRYAWRQAYQSFARVPEGIASDLKRPGVSRDS
jgi:hypothetical protein